jgi:hypothetical protein
LFNGRNVHVFPVKRLEIMTTVELEIIAFLKQTPDVYFARKEISRKARRREDYEEDPHWASGPLNSLVGQGYVIQNDSGHYALSPTYDGQM